MKDVSRMKKALRVSLVSFEIIAQNVLCTDRVTLDVIGSLPTHSTVQSRIPLLHKNGKCNGNISFSDVLSSLLLKIHYYATHLLLVYLLHKNYWDRNWWHFFVKDERCRPRGLQCLRPESCVVVLKKRHWPKKNYPVLLAQSTSIYFTRRYPEISIIVLY